MTQTVAILGAKGRLGRVVAAAFRDAGYKTIAIARDAALPRELAGMEVRAADALDRQSLVRATEGVDIFFNGLNPLYPDWATMCPVLTENVIAAGETHRALHLFAGNVYNYGSPMPPVISESTPFNPSTRKGHIRVEMERRFREAADRHGLQTAVLRPGDFFGGTGRGAWFDLVMASKMANGVYTAAGPADLVHEWAYLPDLAKAFVALADNREKLGVFENLNFPGHAVTDLEMKAAAEKALGRSLRLANLPWWALKVLGLVQPMMRETVEMAYLRFEEHRLVSERLPEIIGAVPHTPLDQAVHDALVDLGIIGNARLAA